MRAAVSIGAGFVDVADRHRRARFGERGDDRGADAARTARDQCDLSATGS